MMRPRTLLLLVAGAVLLLGGAAYWAFRERGTLSVPTYLKIEGAAYNFYQSSGRWPQNLEEALNADEEMSDHLRERLQSERFRTAFTPTDDGLTVTYTGPGPFRDFRIVRRIDKDGNSRWLEKNGSPIEEDAKALP